MKMSRFRMSNGGVLKKFVLTQMIAMLFNSIYLIVDGIFIGHRLGPVFGVMIIMPHFIKREGKLFLHRVTLQKPFLVSIIKKGSAAFVTNFSIGMIPLFYNLVSVGFGYGDMGLSAYLIIGYIALIALRCFMGAAQRIQPILGLYQKQGDDDRIISLNRYMLVFISGFAAVLTLGIFMFNDLLARIFTSDAELIEMSFGISRLYFTSLIFSAINILIATNLQALNQQKSALMLSLSRTSVPLVISLGILGKLLPNNGIWWAMTST